MNEQDLIVPAVQVPYSSAKSAKKSTGQVLVTVGTTLFVALVALARDPDFVAKAVELAGDNRNWVLALTVLRFAVGFYLDRRKHKDGGVVAVKDAF